MVCAPHQRLDVSSPNAHSGLGGSGCAADVSSGCSMGGTVSKGRTKASNPCLMACMSYERTYGHKRDIGMAAKMQAKAASELSLSQSCSGPELGASLSSMHPPQTGLVPRCSVCLCAPLQDVERLCGAALALRPRWHAPQLLQNGLHFVQKALHQPASTSRAGIAQSRAQACWMGKPTAAGGITQASPSDIYIHLQGTELEQSVLSTLARAHSASGADAACSHCCAMSAYTCCACSCWCSSFTI